MKLNGVKDFFGFFLMYVFLLPTAFSQELPTFTDLPVQWQPLERWQWQGQKLSSQRFSSKHDVFIVAQQIQKHAAGINLRVQRLASAWLLSFDHEPTKSHYLFLLSAQSHGTVGWFSIMSLVNTQNSTATLVPTTLFTGLYENSWSIGNVDENTIDEPLYVLLKPKSRSQKLWQQLNTRLLQYAWQGASCQRGQWCQWHKGLQKIWFWEDSQLGLWHVLWWPNQLRGKQ